MALVLRQSTAVDVLIGPFVDSTDGSTAEEGLTISQADVLLSKNGQALTQKNDNTAAVHDANGYYNCELDATDTNTVGTLVLTVAESGALPVRHEFQVIEEAAYDAIYAASAPGPLPADDDGSGLTEAGGTGDQLTAVPWNAAWDAEVQSEVADALAVYDPPTHAELTSGLDALPTAAEIRAEMDSNSTQLAAIVADTNELQTDWADGGRLDLILDARASQSSVDTIDNFLDTEIAAILEDTGTTIPATLSTIAGYIDTEVAAILVDTGTTLDGKLDTIDGIVDAIKVQTDKLTFSAAGFVDANVMEINDNGGLSGDGDETPISKA